MASLPKYKIVLTHLDWNIQHFGQILSNKKTDYYRDAAIHRFSQVFKATQKSLSILTEEKADIINLPDMCFKNAKEKKWAIETYNLLIIDYQSVKDGFKSDIAEKIYPQLDSYHYFFQKLHNALKKFV